jgi:hypothetical protein
MKTADKITVSINGTPAYSTWVKGFWHKGRSTSVYMANGAVFSRSTQKQLPAAMNHNATFRVIG